MSRNPLQLVSQRSCHLETAFSELRFLPAFSLQTSREVVRLARQEQWSAAPGAAVRPARVNPKADLPSLCSQVRFVCIMCLGAIQVLCATLLLRRPNMMAFRVGGALESLQQQYFLLNLCFSMVTFDLQAQVQLHRILTSAVIFPLC